MKNKYLIIILIVLIITLIAVCFLKVKKGTSKDSDKEKTSRNFILESNNVSQINTHGENAGIYVGVNENGKENYLFISIKINKKASKEEQANSLISSISKAIGYKIDINSITIDENKIKIDFAKTAAPFELDEAYDIDSRKTIFYYK